MISMNRYANPAAFWGSSVPALSSRPALRSRFGDFVLLLFLLAQCFDGVFTYVGVTIFGIGIEANPLIAALMLHLGHGTALLGAKTLAVFLGIALHLRQTHTVIALLTALYVAASIVPWVTILFL
jgi:hypothetical protein